MEGTDNAEAKAGAQAKGSQCSEALEEMAKTEDRKHRRPPDFPFLNCPTKQSRLHLKSC